MFYCPFTLWRLHFWLNHSIELSNFPLTLEVDLAKSKKGQKTVTSWLNEVFRRRHYVEVCLKVSIEMNLAMATFHCSKTPRYLLCENTQLTGHYSHPEWQEAAPAASAAQHECAHRMGSQSRRIW